MTFVAPTLGQTYHPRVYAAFGFTIDDDPGTWVWTDITRYCRNADGGVYGPIAFSGGRGHLGGQADPAQITLMLDNTDGRFTALNPYLRNGSANPYWPNVVINTPLKVAITWDHASAEYELLTTFVVGWPQQPNAGVINVTAPITAQGRLRIMRRSTQTVASALFREIKNIADAGVVYDGYWPMEDDATSLRFVHGPVITSQLANIQIPGIPRVAPATITGVPGSKPLPDFSKGAHVTAPITQINTGVGAFTIDHVLFVGDTPSGSGLVPITRTFFGNGSFRISMDLSASGWQLDYIDTSGAVSTLSTKAWNVGGASAGYPFDNNPHMLRLVASQVGGDIDLEFDVDGVEVMTAVQSTTTITNAYQIGIAGTVTGFPFGLGHFVAWNRFVPVDTTWAMQGWLGELANVRAQRLADDNGLPITVLTGTVASQAMGPQTVDTLDNLFEQCADTDNGLFHDAGINGGLVYVSGTYRYNRAVDMTLDYYRHQIDDALVSTYDDQDLVNQVTISRTGGSSATKPDMPPTGILYAISDTVSCATDDQLDDIAGWRLHVGQSATLQYQLPAIGINMRTTPELASAATSVVLPFHLSPIHVPSPYPPGSLDQFVEGFTGIVDSVRWEYVYTCTPYAPWRVAVYGTDRYDDSNTVLTSSETLTSTDATVTPSSAGAWTLSASSLPFTVSCDLEVMQVADIANGTSIIIQDGTFEVTQASSGWTPTSCTFTDDATHVHTGAHAAKMVVTGTPAQAFARMNQVSGIVVGDSYTLHGWAFATSGLTNVQIAIDWFTSGGAFVSTSNASFTLTANVWNAIRVTANAPATAGKAGVGPTLGGTPATGTTCWFDDFAFTHQVGVNGSTQTMTVVRNNSGVATAHSTGAAVHVYPLPIYAL